MGFECIPSGSTTGSLMFITESVINPCPANLFCGPENVVCCIYSNVLQNISTKGANTI